MILIPVAEELDLKKCAKLSGNKKVEMLPMKDLLDYWLYPGGGCSPVGMKAFPDLLYRKKQGNGELHYLRRKKRSTACPLSERISQFPTGRVCGLYSEVERLRKRFASRR